MATTKIETGPQGQVRVVLPKKRWDRRRAMPCTPWVRQKMEAKIAAEKERAKRKVPFVLVGPKDPVPTPCSGASWDDDLVFSIDLNTGVVKRQKAVGPYERARLAAATDVPFPSTIDIKDNAPNVKMACRLQILVESGYHVKAFRVVDRPFACMFEPVPNKLILCFKS